MPTQSIKVSVDGEFLVVSLTDSLFSLDKSPNSPVGLTLEKKVKAKALFLGMRLRMARRRLERAMRKLQRVYPKFIEAQ